MKNVVLLVSILVLSDGIALGAQQQSAPCDRWQLSAPVPNGKDLFGSAVVLSSQEALVGAPNQGPRQGDLHVYLRSGLQWIHADRIRPSDSSNGNRFGYSVSVDGNRMVVGAYGDSTIASVGGSAYVFERVAGAWIETTKLIAPKPVASGFFGGSVALSGDTIAIGGNEEAHVFFYNGVDWVHQAKLRPHDPMLYAFFGFPVVIQGSTILVGAPGDDNLGQDAGAVYVFERTGTTWHEKAKLFASDGQGQVRFGSAIAIDGDRAVIGINTGIPIGAAYVFEYINQSWVETAKLTTHSPSASHSSGYSVALDGDRAAIGATESLPGLVVRRTVHVFDRIGGTWIETNVLGRLEDDGTMFGRSISILGNEVLVGVPCEFLCYFGSASIFLLDQAITTYCTAKPNSNGCLPEIAFAGCPAASMTSGFEVVATKIRPDKPGVLLYGTHGKAAIPFSGGIMCIAPPVKRTPVVNSQAGYGSGCPGSYAISSIDMAASPPALLVATPILRSRSQATSSTANGGAATTPRASAPRSPTRSSTRSSRDPAVPFLLPLDRRRRLGRDVQNAAIDAAHRATTAASVQRGSSRDDVQDVDGLELARGERQVRARSRSAARR